MGIISLLIFPKSPSHCFQCEDIGNPAKRDFKRFLMSVSNLFSEHSVSSSDFRRVERAGVRIS